MIVLILLGIGFLIGPALIISCFLEPETIACYDPKGVYTCDFGSVQFKNLAEQNRVQEEIEANYRAKHKLKPEDPVDSYYVRCHNIPVKFKTRIVAGCVDFDTIRGYAGWVVGVVMLIAFAACSITCIARHGQLHQEEYATKLNVALDNLQDRQNRLYDTLDGELNITTDASGNIYHIIVDVPSETRAVIDTYNADVRAFQEKIYLEKIRSESPWTNTFINPGFKKVEGYNPNAKIYNKILGDTLKTFKRGN